MTQEQALEILKTGANVFLTGEPGAGKTYTINKYIRYAREHGMEVAITASTGIAATHLHGMTIHSWSGIGIKSFLSGSDLKKIATSDQVRKRITKANILVIDEISMLPASSLEMVDRVCKAVRQNNLPFGGLQVVFVGDFFQLPPIIKNTTESSPQGSIFDEENAKPKVFAYEANAWQLAKPVVCYLSEQHRQEDGVFLEFLTALRRKKLRQEHLDLLNKCLQNTEQLSLVTTKLYSHNADVDAMNTQQLARLPGEYHKFTMTSTGRDGLVASLIKGCLSPEVLELKVGAVVMCTKNNQKDGFVNGTLATVDSFDKTSGNPIIKTRHNKYIEIKPASWEIEDNGVVRASITQIPLRLAWAITVHKSQGMSMDAAIMDLSGNFAYGQGYVALSRVRSLSGLRLLGYNQRSLEVHPEVFARDGIFRQESQLAQDNFFSIPESELVAQQLDFIVRNGGSVAPQEIKKAGKIKNKEKGSTYDQTLGLFQEGKSMEEIAHLRSINLGTVLSHLEKLVKDGKLEVRDPARILNDKLIRALPDVAYAINEKGIDRLTPLYEAFAGKYKYDELRLMRLALGNVGK